MGENFDRNLALFERIAAMAAAREVMPAQLALAWVLAQGDDIVPIPGTKRIRYLDENVAAAAIGLTPAELDELAHLLVPVLDDVSVVSEQRHEVGEDAEASLHQVRVEIADDRSPFDPAEREELCDRLLDEVTAWAETCIADRHAEVSEL